MKIKPEDKIAKEIDEIRENSRHIFSSDGKYKIFEVTVPTQDILRFHNLTKFKRDEMIDLIFAIFYEELQYLMNRVNLKEILGCEGADLQVSFSKKFPDVYEVIEEFADESISRLKWMKCYADAHFQDRYWLKSKYGSDELMNAWNFADMNYFVESNIKERK